MTPLNLNTHTQQSRGVWVKYGPRACWHLRQLFVKMDVWAVDPESVVRC